jgi:hypothetical protein
VTAVARWRAKVTVDPALMAIALVPTETGLAQMVTGAAKWRAKVIAARRPMAIGLVPMATAWSGAMVGLKAADSLAAGSVEDSAAGR